MARRKLEQGVALITGASSGIGRALAHALGACQVSLVLNARRQDRLETLAAELEQRGVPSLVVAGDVTQTETRARLIEGCQSKFGGLDFLINNAGIGAMGPFRDAAPERLRRIMEVNFFAPAELTRAALPLLAKSNRAIIVNIGSVLGHRAVGLKSEYCASKFALHGWSDALRTEVAGEGIDVLLVSPSTTDSEFFDAAIEDPTGIQWTERGAVPPEYVARKTVAAMRRGAHEIILTAGGKALVWLDRLAPSLANRMLAQPAHRAKPQD